MKKLCLLFAPFALTGCITNEDTRLTDFLNGPIGSRLIRVAATVGANAIDQYAAGKKVDGKTIAQDALSGASAELRKAQNLAEPATATEAKAVAKEALVEGTGVPAISKKIAAPVANAIADAVKNQGAPADLALEAAARGLDQAAAAK